jgi:hypothetical protein
MSLVFILDVTRACSFSTTCPSLRLACKCDHLKVCLVFPKNGISSVRKGGWGMHSSGERKPSNLNVGRIIATAEKAFTLMSWCCASKWEALQLIYKCSSRKWSIVMKWSLTCTENAGDTPDE